LTQFNRNEEKIKNNILIVIKESNYYKNTKVQIPQVADNYEKRDAYQYNMRRFNKARREEYHLESLWILYAMAEDRTTSFLYHIGFVAEKSRSRAANRVKTDVRAILGLKADKNGHYKYSFGSLSGKLNAIAKVLAWSPTEDANAYQRDLHMLLHRVSIGETQAAVSALDEWRDIRNQIVHELFSKKTDNVENQLIELVSAGYGAVRTLDNAIKAIKRGASIRKRYKIQ